MSNLDDFFKKRDKKKKTVKTKLDIEQLAKNLEATSITQSEEVDAEFQDTKERVSVTENLDEEWKPFDSEENRDYTGLRINTNTWNDEDEEYEYKCEVDENTSKPAWVPSAWGSKTKEEQQKQSDEEEKEEETKNQASSEPKSLAAVIAEGKSAEPAETKTETSSAAPSTGAYIPPAMRARMAAEAAAKQQAEPPKTTGAYVPPSLRNRAPEASSSSASYEIPTSSVNYRRPNKSQPNLNDCLEFPSLDAASDNNPTPAGGNDDRFEFAKKSGRVEQKNEKDSQIHIQNKFATLSSNQ